MPVWRAASALRRRPPFCPEWGGATFHCLLFLFPSLFSIFPSNLPKYTRGGDHPPLLKGHSPRHCTAEHRGTASNISTDSFCGLENSSAHKSHAFGVSSWSIPHGAIEADNDLLHISKKKFQIDLLPGQEEKPALNYCREK